MRTRLLIAAAGTAALPPLALGQCPSWDTGIGNPGIAGGYAAPVRAWNDGSGEKVYVGGSFTSAGGNPANQYLARWDRSTSSWSPLGSGISGGFTNAFMTSLLPFNPGTGERLVAGGFFDTAGGVPQTASLAMWNGQAWEPMGTGWTGTTRQSVWAMAVFGGRLYIGGGIVNQPALIEGQPWAGMASWDGSRWTPTISALGGSFSPYIAAMAVFNDGSGDALYIAGRFSSINGVAGTPGVARWNGTAWSAVGGGLNSTSTLFGPEAMTVFDDGGGAALYVAGYAMTASGMGATNVAKWNGQNWASLGGQIGTGRLTSIVGFNDGGGPKLYIGGTAMPQISYVARWENNTWTPVGGGITGPGLPPSNFPSVFGLGVAADKLYVAGNFSQVNSQAAAGVAAWLACPLSCYANCDGSSVAPVLNVADFICFQNRYAAGDTYANCDSSTAPPMLNVADFVCFQNRFAAGCQ